MYDIYCSYFLEFAATMVLGIASTVDKYSSIAFKLITRNVACRYFKPQLPSSITEIISKLTHTLKLNASHISQINIPTHVKSV